MSDQYPKGKPPRGGKWMLGMLVAAGVVILLVGFLVQA